MSLSGVEINETAAKELERSIGKEGVFQGSILDYPTNSTKDLSIIKEMLILLPNYYLRYIKNYMLLLATTF